MGEMADWILEQTNWELDDEGPIIPHGFWMQKTGQLIKISEMTDKHLENAIKLFTKNGRKDEVLELIEEQKNRAEKKKEEKYNKHPLYKAFKAGWEAGYKSCSYQAWPEVGPGGAPSFDNSWEIFKKQKNENVK